MSFSNDISIDADHTTPQADLDADDDADAAGETATLLGRGTSISTTSTSSSSRVSHFVGLTGFLIAFVILCSSGFLFLVIRGTIFSTTEVGTIEQVQQKDRNGILAGDNNAFAVGEIDAYDYDSLRKGSNYLDGDLKQPEVMKMSQHVEGYCPVDQKPCPHSTDNVYVLTLEKGIHQTKITKSFQSRLFNGILPGPTIRIKPGDTLRVQFHNKLTTQEGAIQCKKVESCSGIHCEVKNKFCEPDYTNIHYHGFHGSGEQPSDDIEMTIAPGSSYSYRSLFSSDHMPGTHWIHPHAHGSSALQVGGGAALALIVEDDVTKIPTEVATAKDVILVVQQFDIGKTTSIGGKSFNRGHDDAVFKVKTTPLNNNFRLVNGQYQPKLTIQPGAWQRFRVIYAGWGTNLPDLIDGSSSLNFKISNNSNNEACETYLLAKDGMYLSDYPRKLDIFPIPVAGRADIMVRCNAEGTYNVNHFSRNKVLFTIVVKGPLVKSDGPTKNFPFPIPRYLQNVQQEPFGEGCSCTTHMYPMIDKKKFWKGVYGFIQGYPYKPHDAVHTIKNNEVIERKLIGVGIHPYHQHVHPFQLTKGFNENEWSSRRKNATMGGYFKNGDWHDTIFCKEQNKITIKYHPYNILGKVMIHCHILEHEDKGMMAQEKVVEKHPCNCDRIVMSDKELQHYSNKMAVLANKNN